MAKVIKEGTRYIDRCKNWKATVVCREEEHVGPKDLPPCGSEVKITEKDLIKMYYMGDHGGHHSYAAWKCPVCGKINSVAPNLRRKKLPDPVWLRLCERMGAEWDGWQEGAPGCT